MKVHGYIDKLPDYRGASTGTYLTGFALSLVLTAASFALVWAYVASDGIVFSRGVLIAFLAILAVSQLLVQVIFFLHVSTEREIRLNLFSGVFTILVVLTIVIGSIWVMQNLDYNMSHGPDIERVIQDEEGIYRS